MKNVATLLCERNFLVVAFIFFTLSGELKTL